MNNYTLETFNDIIHFDHNILSNSLRYIIYIAIQIWFG